ncbi:MAG: citrate lyase holo-[acyl-carrier protein] synthase [Firmicutes bacterium]|nr:citrate lyase holo-[acyl-carrier protein] synthase [Bacillota bacterium]
MTEIRKVELPDMLACREARAARQRQLIEEYKKPVVSLSMNIAGDVKRTPAISMQQKDGEEDFKAAAAKAGLAMLFEERSDAFTGPESMLVFDADAQVLKDIGVAIEDETPWGRLYDIDVIGTDGEKLSRPEPRRCIVCGGPAADCARSRAHGLDQICEAADGLIGQYLGDTLGTAAASALVREAALTPKPGLVDAANNGAHKDMDLDLLLTSASAIRPFFAQMAGFSAAYGTDIEALIKIGKSAEKAMFAATKGVNAHKGAIFAFSLYLAAVADVLMRGGDPVEKVKDLAAEKVANARPSAPTHGDAVRAVYSGFGREGALAEACKGFPMALLAMQTIRETGDDLLALCRVMSQLADSNVLYRSGVKGLNWVRSEASRLCAMDAVERNAGLRVMDQACIARNISPGGAADMLALGMFLADLPAELFQS